MQKTIIKKVVEKELEAPIVKRLEPMTETKVTVNLPMIILVLAIIVAGGFTGYVLARSNRGNSVTIGSSIKSGSETTSKLVGLKCEQKSGEIPEGLLKTGGIDHEGTHHLEREGGPARNIYLTSSAVPLDDYEGKKVRVCGDTLKAEKAGWFIDVANLEVIE